MVTSIELLWSSLAKINYFRGLVSSKSASRKCCTSGPYIFGFLQEIKYRRWPTNYGTAWRKRLEWTENFSDTFQSLSSETFSGPTYLFSTTFRCLSAVNTRQVSYGVSAGNGEVDEEEEEEEVEEEKEGTLQLNSRKIGGSLHNY